MRVLVMHDDRRVAGNLAATLRQEGETRVEIRQRSPRSHRAREIRLHGARSLRSLKH